MKLYLFPTFAAPAKSREGAEVWRIPLSGVALKSRTRKIKRRVLINILRRLTDVPDSELESELCAARTAPFFLAGSRKRKFQFSLNGRALGGIGKTKRNGQFRTKLEISDKDARALGCADGRAELTAIDDKTGEVATRIKVPFVPAVGRSVISDIDDTIKFSNVENRAELLANTFTRPFRPIDGVAPVFQQLLAAQHQFHYVTASPWQLYEPLLEFISEHGYPAGSMHFRIFRVSDHLLKRLGVIHRGGKSAAVRRILSCFPSRRFTLIGDSGEKDAEIYARCYQLFPDQVERILIRLVRPEHQHSESVIKARLELPASIFQVFGNSGELASLLSET